MTLLSLGKGLKGLKALKAAARTEAIGHGVLEWAAKAGLASKIALWAERLKVGFDAAKSVYDVVSGIESTLSHIKGALGNAAAGLKMGWNAAKDLGGKALRMGAMVGTDLLNPARGSVVGAGLGALTGGLVGATLGAGVMGGIGAVSGAFGGMLGGAALGLVTGGPLGMIAGAAIGGVWGAVIGGLSGIVAGAAGGGLLGMGIGAKLGGVMGFALASGRVPRDGELTGPFGPDGNPIQNADAEKAIGQGATIFVNGINTSYEDHCKTAARIARDTKARVVGVYNATGVKSGKLGGLGILRDVAQVIGDKFNGVGRQPATEKLATSSASTATAKEQDGGLRSRPTPKARSSSPRPFASAPYRAGPSVPPRHDLRQRRLDRARRARLYRSTFRRRASSLLQLLDRPAVRSGPS